MSYNEVPVYSISDLAASPGDFEIVELESAFSRSQQDVLKPHRHDYFEIFWISGGGGALTVDFDDYEIKPPMLLLFSPGRIHAWKPLETPKGFVIRFDGNFCAAESSDRRELPEMPIFHTIGGDPVLYLDTDENPPFELLTAATFREFGGEGLEKTAALRSFLRLILIYAKRIAETRHSTQTQTPGFYLTRRFLYLVEQNYRHNQTLDFYAERLKVTPNHLTTTVKINLGKTAGEIIRERQIVEAKRLLRFTEMTVAEIAFQLSFDDPSYFARFFRRHTSQTPTDFRQSVNLQS